MDLVILPIGKKLAENSVT